MGITKAITRISLLILAIFFYATPAFASGETITVTPDYGTNATITLAPSGFSWWSGGSTGYTVSFFNEDGTFLYVSGNPTASGVNWFGNSNGHGSGDVSFSTQTYKIVAWQGDYSGSTLQDNNFCYGSSGATYDDCLSTTRVIAVACYAYGGATGCSIGGGETPPPSGELKPTITTTFFGYYSTTTCNSTSSTTQECVTAYSTTTPQHVTSDDLIFLLSIIIFFLSFIWLGFIYSIFKQKRHGVF